MTVLGTAVVAIGDPMAELPLWRVPVDCPASGAGRTIAMQAIR
jgi:hypothetical protein